VRGTRNGPKVVVEKSERKIPVRKLNSILEDIIKMNQKDVSNKELS
jgi:hypothetical protein